MIIIIIAITIITLAIIVMVIYSMQLISNNIDNIINDNNKDHTNNANNNNNNNNKTIMSTIIIIIIIKLIIIIVILAICLGDSDLRACVIFTRCWHVARRKLTWREVPWRDMRSLGLARCEHEVSLYRDVKWYEVKSIDVMSRIWWPATMGCAAWGRQTPRRSFLRSKEGKVQGRGKDFQLMGPPRIHNVILQILLVY